MVRGSVKASGSGPLHHCEFRDSQGAVASLDLRLDFRVDHTTRQPRSRYSAAEVLSRRCGVGLPSLGGRLALRLARRLLDACRSACGLCRSLVQPLPSLW